MSQLTCTPHSSLLTPNSESSSLHRQTAAIGNEHPIRIIRFAIDILKAEHEHIPPGQHERIAIIHIHRRGLLFNRFTHNITILSSHPGILTGVTGAEAPRSSIVRGGMYVAGGW